MSRLYNVKGSGVAGGQDTWELISPDDEYVAKSILIANVHDSADAVVRLFIEDDPTSGSTNRYEIIHELAIPTSSSLSFEVPLAFKVPLSYGLYAKVSSGTIVDIIIST